MKDVYVNKEGVICACTLEVPEQPKNVCRQCEGKGWVTGIERPCGSCNPGGEWRSSKTTYQKYNAALQACKESAVPFDEQDHAFHALYLETKTDYKINATFSEWFNNFLKPDTFYQIEADWEIVEVQEYPIDHTSYPPMKKVARLKVPAPTVATDNSGEKSNLESAALDYAKNHSTAPDRETPDWIIADFKAGAKWALEQKQGDRLLKALKQAVLKYGFSMDPSDEESYERLISEIENKKEASPVEEEQDQLWREVDKIFNVKWSYGMPDQVMEELKEKFTITRKS